MTKESAYGYIKELLKAEEAADSLNLTRAVRRKLQQVVEDVFTAEDKPANTISVEMPEGQFVAYAGTDPDYPAMHIVLIPSGTEYEISMATAEYDPDKGIRSIVWGNAMDEDYTYVERLKNLDQWRKQVEEEN